jgi:CBS domain containing-hemolysin-like protein
MESLGLKVLELSDKTVNEIIQSWPQFIYCSTENATSTSFLEALQSELHEAVLPSVDESYTVETWMGKR